MLISKMLYNTRVVSHAKGRLLSLLIRLFGGKTFNFFCVVFSLRKASAGVR